MPTSEASNITAIVQAVCTINPKSILDLGVGCGKYGALCREYLDLSYGRNQPEQWEANIVGVEGWEKYRNPMWNLYSQVLIEDFTKPAQMYANYDLVLMIDSLEHLPKDEGKKLLEQLLQHNHFVIVSCPWGANYLEQEAVFGNEYERHRAHWRPNDFVSMGGRLIHLGVCVVAIFANEKWKQ